MPYRTDIKGWMFEDELQTIEQLAKIARPIGVIAEVGSFCGKSTVTWAMNCDPSVTIYCFDPFYENIEDQNGIVCNTWEEFKRNTSEFPNVIPIRGFCPDQARYTDSRYIDIFFLDASHHNPSDWEIIQHFLPFIRSGGIICGHDYSLYNLGATVAFPDVNLNVHRLEEMIGKKATIVNTFWYLQKP